MSIHTNIKEIIKKHGRGIINLTIAVGVSFILSAGSLYFSTGQFGIEMFKSYFANVYTIILNTAPILFVILILLIIVNRLWISVGIASILVIVLSLINYFKLSEYYGAAEPPVRCGESHLSGLTEPPHFVY